MNQQTPRRSFLRTLAAGTAGAWGCAGAPPVLATGNTPVPSPPASPDPNHRADGQNYAPRGKPQPVVHPGEFVFAAAHLDHGHIYGQCNGLTEAGATLKWVFEPDSDKATKFVQQFPGVQRAASLQQILDDPEIRLVATASIPNLRGPIGCRVMQAGKDYFTDKPPFTTLEQLQRARQVVSETGRKFMVYYSERLHNESAMFATDLVQQGAIGRVLQVLGLGPHREGNHRPAWFYDPKAYGGILCDIGSHQFEQFLTYANCQQAKVLHSAVANYSHPQHPQFEDFGQATLLADNGATNYVRVDWFTPKGMSTWGDGRLMLLGDQGTIELRKYVDVARSGSGNQVYLVDASGEHHFEVEGKVGFRYFGQLILDCLHRTENAMTQAHAFLAAELALQAQAQAQRLG